MKSILLCLALVYAQAACAQCAVQDQDKEVLGSCQSRRAGCKASSVGGHPYPLPNNEKSFCAVSEESVNSKGSGKDYLIYKIYLLDADYTKFLWEDADLNGAVLAPLYCPGIARVPLLGRLFDSCKGKYSTTLTTEERPGMISAACTKGEDNKQSVISTGDDPRRTPSPLGKIWKPVEAKKDVLFDHYICESDNPTPRRAGYVRFDTSQPALSLSPLPLLRPVKLVESGEQEKPRGEVDDSARSGKYVFPFWPNGRVLLAQGLGNVTKEVGPASGWRHEKVLLNDAGLLRKMPFKTFALEGAVTGGIAALTAGFNANSKGAASGGAGAGAFALTFGIEYFLQRRRDRIFLERVSQWLKGNRKDKYDLLICDTASEKSLEIGLEALGSPAAVRTISYTPQKSEVFGLELNTSKH